MRKKEDYDLEKITLNLRRGDFARLQFMHGREGAGKTIRKLVIAHISNVDHAINQRDYLNPAILEDIE
jgi:hypothetical protein